MIAAILQWTGAVLLLAAMYGALKAEGRPIDLSSAKS
jgi:hypothetical protein